jgi:LacI family transcriptional regulator
MTIKDVAEMAHVSKGTVSRVINGVPGVGEETRRRVMKLIETLDFHPNAAARGLAAKRAHTLGLVIPHTGRYSMTSTFWPVLLTSITEQAAARGLNVLLSTARAEDDVDSALRAILRGRRVDGAIIGAEQFGEKQLAELVLKGLPFVMIGRSPYLSSCSVDVDNAAGAREAVQHLIGCGHRTIAMLAGPENLPYVHERVRGFREAMEAAGLDPGIVASCPYDTEEAVRCTKRVLAGNPVTALFVAAGDLVLGAMKAVTEEGRSIPRDLSLVSFDDHPFFPHFTPAVTAVGQPIEDMGKAAVLMLFELIAGRQPEEKAVILPPKLLARASCARPMDMEKTPR